MITIPSLASVRKYLITAAAANELGLSFTPCLATLGDAYIQLYCVAHLLDLDAKLGDLTVAKAGVTNNDMMAKFVDSSNLLQWWIIESPIIMGTQTMSDYMKATILEYTFGVLYHMNKLDLLQNLAQVYFTFAVKRYEATDD